MFELKAFLMKTLEEMAKSEPAYQVNRYALGWFDKGVLELEDLALVDQMTTPEATIDGPEDLPDYSATESGEEMEEEGLTGQG